MNGRESILYFAPSFLEDRRDRPLRGVQLFDLHHIRELAELGLRVVVPAEGTWRTRLEQRLADTGVELMFTARFGKPVLAGLAAAWRLRRPAHGRPFDAMLLGNPAKGALPAVEVLRARGVVGRIVLQAHKAPGLLAASRLRAWGATLTAVSRQVADQFPTDLRERVSVCYGVANAEAFTPSPRVRPPDEPVRFAMLGKLDNPWKGAALAVRALESMPQDLRSRVRLHLASFGRSPPAVRDPSVVYEPWIEPQHVPAFLRSMDALIVASYGPDETFSQSIVQGMLCGLPIISSDLPVLADKVADGGGLLFPAADPRRPDLWNPGPLADAMIRIADDAALRARLGVEARRIAAARYVWNTRRFVDRYLLPKDTPSARPDAAYAG
ncbi:MAG: glycosyltransferase family 4 protein [Phycisphaerae bacterium]|nr:glycosyltransferase family 4 protein [Phycisphaerae bacterium]